MRTRTSLCFLAGCCAALTACTAAPPKGPDPTVTTPAVGRPPPPASAQAAVSREAFTPYAGLGLSNDDGLAPGESTFALAGACMTAEGYPGAAAASAADNINLGVGYLSFTFPWGAWGYLGAADAQQYGFQPFGLIQNALGVLGDYAGPPNPASLSQPEQDAANKCITIGQDLANTVDDGPLAGIGTLSNDISADVQHDAAVKAATRAWSACMAKNGYSFGAPQPVWRHELTAMYGGQHAITPSTSVSASAQQAQIAAAVTDSGCTLSSDLAGIYFAVQASYEQQLVTANQQALAAAVSVYRAAYAKELKRLPALLRTAKAQPFHPVKATARRSRAS
jgi:hypothetical protein